MQPGDEDVERFAQRAEQLSSPKSANWAVEWRALLDRITADLAVISPKRGRAVLVRVLVAICNALEYQKRLQSIRAHPRAYDEERERIEHLLDEIADSNVVSQFSHSIEYFGPGEYLCFHGRKRKVCERLYGELVWCKHPLFPTTIHLSPFVLRRVEIAIGELRKHGINPRTETLDDLCCPDLSTHAFAPIPTRRPGAPFDHVGSLLLSTVVGQLAGAGLTIRASCLHLADIRALCFPSLDRRRGETGELTDREDVAETLEREWRKLRKEQLEVNEITLHADSAS